NFQADAYLLWRKASENPGQNVHRMRCSRIRLIRTKSAAFAETSESTHCAILLLVERNRMKTFAGIWSQPAGKFDSFRSLFCRKVAGPTIRRPSYICWGAANWKPARPAVVNSCAAESLPEPYSPAGKQAIDQLHRHSFPVISDDLGNFRFTYTSAHAAHHVIFVSLI